MSEKRYYGKCNADVIDIGQNFAIYDADDFTGTESRLVAMSHGRVFGRIAGDPRQRGFFTVAWEGSLPRDWEGTAIENARSAALCESGPPRRA